LRFAWWFLITSVFRVVLGLFRSRHIFLGPRVQHSIFIGPVLSVQNMRVADIDNFPLILTEPPQGYLHLLVRSSVIHLEGEHLLESQLVGQILSDLDYLRVVHFFKDIPNFASILIGLVLDHTQILPLLDFPPLLHPPPPTLLQPHPHILPGLQVGQVAYDREQLLVGVYFVLVGYQTF